MKQAGEVSAAETLEELYGTNGLTFIQTAFTTFLGRKANPSETEIYLARLDSGVSKRVIATELRYSNEARQRSQTLDLRKSRLLLAPGRIPLLGRFYDLLSAILGSRGTKRTVLAQQQLIHQLRAQIQKQEQRCQELQTSLERYVDVSDSRFSQLSDAIGALESRLGNETQAIQDRLLTEIRQGSAETMRLAKESSHDFQALRTRLQQLQEQVAQLDPNQAATDSGATVDDAFYVAFEQHFRGSESVIQERLAYYLPVLQDGLSEAAGTATMVDIGCGRGEWINLLHQNGYSAIGIDTNADNISRCHEKGLQAICTDAIDWLRQAESQSLGLVSAIHVIEHLTLPQLNALLTEALRCLVPGGMIILETPNPENLITASHLFYTDPSHRNPIPPDLAQFLLRNRGFDAVEIHRLQPQPESALIDEDSEAARRLNQLLYGPQDYAVVACKS